MPQCAQSAYFVQGEGGKTSNPQRGWQATPVRLSESGRLTKRGREHSLPRMRQLHTCRSSEKNGHVGGSRRGEQVKKCKGNSPSAYIPNTFLDDSNADLTLTQALTLPPTFLTERVRNSAHFTPTSLPEESETPPTTRQHRCRTCPKLRPIDAIHRYRTRPKFRSLHANTVTERI